jgi:hypothetical protein
MQATARIDQASIEQGLRFIGAIKASYISMHALQAFNALMHLWLFVHLVNRDLRWFV